MKLNPEKIIQIKIVNWLTSKHPDIPFMANINEQQCTMAWRQIRARMGARKGVSDLFFPMSSQGYKGLWLELKTKEGRPSPSQKSFITEMISLGYHGEFSYGYENAEEIIRNFYAL